QTARHQGHAADDIGSDNTFGDCAPPAFLRLPPFATDDTAPNQSTSTDGNDPHDGSSAHGDSHAGDGSLSHENPAGTRRPGVFRETMYEEQHSHMGKRSNKKQFKDNNENFQLHAISGGWDPIEDRRDQSFIRHVKPRSDGQQQLMDAIEEKALTI